MSHDLVEDEDAALLEGSDNEDIIPSAQDPPLSGAAALQHAILCNSDVMIRRGWGL